MPISEKYLKLSIELARQYKTGRECPYCGISETQTNRYGVFCAGCGIERRPELGTCFGVPVYDEEDVVELMKEFDWMVEK